MKTNVAFSYQTKFHRKQIFDFVENSLSKTDSTKVKFCKCKNYTSNAVIRDFLLFAKNKFSFYYLQNKPEENGFTGIVKTT